MIEGAGHIEHIGEVRSAYNILVVKPDGNRPFGRPGRRREYNDLRLIVKK
jgi:hypothetical protein